MFQRFESKSGVAVYLALVFASGILVGAVATRLYTTSTVNANVAPPGNMQQYREKFLKEMREKVGASSDQLARVTDILDDAKRKLDDMHTAEKPMRDRIDQERIDGIRSVLDEKQRAAFDSWRAERARLQAEKLRKQQEQQKK